MFTENFEKESRMIESGIFMIETSDFIHVCDIYEDNSNENKLPF